MPTPDDIPKPYYLTEQSTAPGVILTSITAGVLSADIVGFHADLNRQAGGTPTAGPLDVIISKNADGDGLVGLYFVSDAIGVIQSTNIYNIANSIAGIELDVTTANADVTFVEARLIVINSSGVQKEDIGITTGTSVLSTTGLHSLNMSSALSVKGFIDPTDRFCLMFKFNNLQAHSGSAIQLAGVDQYITWYETVATKHGYVEMRSYGLTIPTSELGTEVFATNFSNGRGIDQNDEVDLRERIEDAPQRTPDVVGGDIDLGPDENTDITAQQSHAGYIEFSSDAGA